MNCPKCNSEAHTVVDVRDPGPKVTTRRHWCGKAACGARWNSTAQIDKEPRITFHPRGSDFVPRKPTQRVVSITTQPVVPEQHNGLREETQPVVPSSLSSSDLDPIPHPSSLLPVPDLIPVGDQGVDRAEPAGKKGGPIDYPAAFDEFWGAIRSNRNKGMKSLAFQRWKERGRPPTDVLITKWDEYMVSLGDTFALDVCRWIAARGWLETYDAPPTTARRPLARTAGHSPVTAGKDFSAGLDLFKKGAAT